MTVDQLVGYQRAEFALATRFKGWQTLTQLMVGLPAAVSIFVEDKTATYWLAIAGAVLLPAYLWLDYQLKQRRGAAEAARRVTLLIGGLGYIPSAGALQNLRDGFAVTPADAAKCEDPNYFASLAGAGPARLGEMLLESCFYSERLHRTSWQWWGLGLLGVGFVLTVSLLLLLPLGDADLSMTIARLFLVLLAFVLSSDIWGIALGHFMTAGSCREIRNALENAEVAGWPMVDVVKAMGDYASAVEGGPLILKQIYEANKNAIANAWGVYRP